MNSVRFGVLGAAKIVPAALLKPAADTPGVQVRAIAARDRSRAEQFAGKRGIPVVHDSYDDVLADDTIDAVYIPLPNGLHAEWTIKALQAGRHVLCEKPFSANAKEASRVEKTAASTGFVVMEAFHWRYHPLAARMLEIIGNEELGEVRHIEAEMCFPLYRKDDIRWQLDLAGGALMDAGCYPVHMVRTLAGAEPVVTSARANLRSPGVDRVMKAELAFPGGRTGRIVASMWSHRVLSMRIRVEGERATMDVVNPVMPSLWHRLTVKGSAGMRREHVNGKSTYWHQMQAFVAAVSEDGPVLTPPSDSVANMTVIDDIYRAAGMDPRRGSSD